MGSAVAAILVLIGLSAEFLFLLGLGGVTLPGMPGQVAAWSGSPFWGLAGGGVLLLGAFLVGRPREPSDRYAVREVLLLLCACSALLLTTGVVVGAVARWQPNTLAALALGGLSETLLAVFLSVRLAMAEERRKILFSAGASLTVVLGLFQLVLVTLSAV